MSKNEPERRDAPGMVSLTRILGTPAELDALQSVFAGISPATRALIGKPEARHLHAMLPDGKTAGDKFLFGIYAGDDLIGCLDLIRRFPAPDCAYVGLLVLAERNRRLGVGRVSLSLAEDLVASWFGTKRLRLGVTVGNDAAGNFWRAMGFSPTGERSVSRDDCRQVLCDIYEKPLDGIRASKERLKSAEEFATAMDSCDFAVAGRYLSADCRSSTRICRERARR